MSGQLLGPDGAAIADVAEFLSLRDALTSAAQRMGLSQEKLQEAIDGFEHVLVCAAPSQTLPAMQALALAALVSGNIIGHYLRQIEAVGMTEAQRRSRIAAMSALVGNAMSSRMTIERAQDEAQKMLAGLAV